MIFSIEAINLKTIPYQESSQLVVTFTRTHGKETFLAKGVRRSMRSGGGLLQSLLYNRYTISKRGSLGLITGSDCMESFDGMKTDLSALSASYEAANLIFKTAQDGHAN